jgi:hypothetical protein
MQLEGFYLVIAALNNALVSKGIMSPNEIDTALEMAEMAAISDAAFKERSSATRDAIAFPARLLRLANDGATPTSIQSFSKLAKLVGQSKQPYDNIARI